MFATYSDFINAARAALKNKPKGTGYKNQTGVMLMLDAELCYIDEGDSWDDASAVDISAWDDEMNAREFAALKSPTFASVPK